MSKTNTPPEPTPHRRLISAADVENSQITDRYLVGMLSNILSPYKLHITAVFIMLAGVSILTTLLPLLIQRAVDGPITENNLDGLIPLGVLYFALIIFIFTLRFIYTYLLQTVGQNALVTLRQQLFDHILKQDMRFFNTSPVGMLVSRLSNDIEALTELLSTSIVMIVSNMITLASIIITMLLLNVQLALLSMAVLPLMIWGTWFWRKRIREASNRFHRFIAEMLAFLNEQINGMLIVQLFNRQDVSRAEFEVVNRKYRDIHMKMRDYFTAYASVLQILTSAGLAIVLYGGGQGVLAGWATLGMLIAFVDYTRRSFEPITQLAEQFSQIQTALSAGERIARMLNIEPEIKDQPNAQPLHDGQKSLTLENVYFGYDPEHLVLKGLSVHIPVGQRIAIVGATGAGKSSFASLLARYYDVTDGRILLGDQDIREIHLEDLRHAITVVPQNPYCFNGTIADNLRLFNPHITLEQMKKAAEIACAAPFIERLPGSYDFQLLPGGANLSQGQRQLLALARALIHNPDSILVLDEATSNIDTETEAYIQTALEHILRGRTSLIIAHRLSTIRDADRILVMKAGEIVEEGSHSELLHKEGLYANLYQKQFDELEALDETSI